ncbi:MAG TPA: fibronectin type III domain-containing protein [Burkholderiales bacterium]|nr:fibronectin type III domain-containing protein [Burkholderiales bacterium]
MSWTAAPSSSSYNVYTSPTSPVTKAATKTSVTGTTATLPTLANGTPVFVAVAAVNLGGESPLSSEVCAVPTAASTSGLALYDPLCASTLDGKKWRTPLLSRAVANGELVLSNEASNMEALASRGLAYASFAIVNAGTQRVSTLKSKVTVPAASAVRTGTAEIAAGVSVLYQPPANRSVGDIGASLNLIRVQIGLIDTGNGLRALRRVTHCDAAACGAPTSTGIAFADPAGFDSNGQAAAAYDTTYTVSLTLDEASGVFTWSIAGGTFGAGASGTADPAAYLAGNSTWSALGAKPLAAGGGFLNAALRTVILDSGAGGSRGSIAARFDDVEAGFDNAPATFWDDFSGSELSASLWTPSGQHSIAATSGAVVEHAQITSSPSGFLTNFQGLPLSDSTAFNTIQADFTVSACANNSAHGAANVSLEANIYNDGTPGTTPPNDNAPGSMVGEIRAYLILDCVAQVARFQVLRWNQSNPLSGTVLNSTNNIVPMGPAAIVGNTHTMRMTWDPVGHRLTFQVDGQAPVIVDPTTVNARMSIAAPYVKAPNAPAMHIGRFLSLDPGVSPATQASLDFKVNNVFTAP